MSASAVDLRYKTKQILAALERRETVAVLSRGRPKGGIVPAVGSPGCRVQNHAFFGMRSKDRGMVAQAMQDLRGGRPRRIQALTSVSPSEPEKSTRRNRGREDFRFRTALGLPLFLGFSP